MALGLGGNPFGSQFSQSTMSAAGGNFGAAGQSGGGYGRTGRDPYWNPGQFQQDPDFDWSDTPSIGGPSGYLENNPEAIWTRYMGQMGIGLNDTSPFAQYMRQQYQNAYSGFQAGIADDPSLTFQQYLQDIGTPDYQRQFQNLSPQQRGENWARYAGPARWIADV